MSATSAPNGLTPKKMFGERYMTGGFQRIPIASGYATTIYTGDPVQLVAAGTIQLQTTVTNANFVGVFMGVEYTDPTLNYLLHSQRWPASTVASDAMAYVATDPTVLMEIQADATLGQNAVGAHFDFATYAAGDDTHGRSAVALDAASVGTAATQPLRLIDFVDPDEIDSSFPRVLVQWVTHQWLQGQAGI